MTFQNLILKLSEFWVSRGCTLQQPLDVEVGAGTMHPETFLRVLGPAHWKVAYVQPSRRPADGRFGENPNRLFKHHQFQVVLKPSPGVKYADVRLREEVEQSKYVFGQIAIPGAEFGAFHRDLFERYYQLAGALLEAQLVWPALEHTLKCSHLFNILDSSNSIGVTERTAYILRIRQLAIGIAKSYVEGAPASADLGAASGS